MLIDKKRAVVLRPEDPEARFELGEALFLDAELDAAAAQLEKAIELDGDHGNAKAVLARVYLAQGRLTLAEKLFRPRADAGEPAACDALAELYLRSGRFDDALFYTVAACRVEPGRIERRLRAAEMLLEKGLVAQAKSHAEAAPEEPRARAVLREVAERAGDLTAVIESPLDRGPEFLLGRTLDVLGRHRLGGASLEPVVAAFRTRDVIKAKRAFVLGAPPSCAPWVLAWLRGELACASADLDLAKRSFSSALEGTDVASMRALLYARLGEIAAHRRELRGARDAYRAACEAEDSADARERLGDVCVALDALGEAEIAYRKSAELDPSGSGGAKLAQIRARRRRPSETVRNVGKIGGLAWGGRGGLVSPIEAIAVPGKGELIFTGNVGKTGREAAQVAHSCVKARGSELGIAERVTSYDLHLHFADTEVAKDGASAGVALALAAISAFRDEEILPNLAATGEISVQGTVRAVAGLHQKFVAAYLWGIRTIVMPRRNVLDIKDLPAEVRRGVAVHGVDSLAEAVEIAFGLPASS